MSEGKKTKVFYEQFNKHNLFVVYEVDEEGKKVSDKNIISFGIAKAVAIDNHIDELQAFVIREKSK